MKEKKEIKFTSEEIEILKELLNTGDMEDYPREQLQDGYWAKEKFEIFNQIRRKLGLYELEPYCDD